MDEAQVDNQRKLSETLKWCAETNIVLNKDKQQSGFTEIAVHGHRITTDGVKVDEAKVQAIRDMPKAVDVAAVRCLCGMTQYMSRFLPGFAETLEQIRAYKEGHSIHVVHKIRERFCHSKQNPFIIAMPSLF